MESRSDLPDVSGSYSGTLEGFEHRCRILLLNEQAKVSPDNALIGVISDAIRLVRDFCSYPILLSELRETKAKLAELQARLKEA